MATKKNTKRATRVEVVGRDRPQPVPVTIKTRPAKKSKTPMADLIRQGIADRTFI